MLNLINDLIHNPKIAASVSGATVGSGVATVKEWIPIEWLDLGIIASAIGAILSLVLIFTNLSKHFREKKLDRLKIELMERELASERVD